MSRPIKFRAWDTKESRWVILSDSTPMNPATGKLMEDEDNSCRDPDCCGGPWPMWRDQAHFILEQFTGLHDKNGREIYEGDIIQNDGNCHDGVKYKGVVRFGDFKKMPCGFWSDTSVFGCPDGLKIDEYAEVIGNIHETPELLK